MVCWGTSLRYDDPPFLKSGWHVSLRSIIIRYQRQMLHTITNLTVTTLKYDNCLLRQQVTRKLIKLAPSVYPLHPPPFNRRVMFARKNQFFVISRWLDKETFWRIFNAKLDDHDKICNSNFEQILLQFLFFTTPNSVL